VVTADSWNWQTFETAHSLLPVRKAGTNCCVNMLALNDGENHVVASHKDLRIAYLVKNHNFHEMSKQELD
jgi:hypothetical protein